MNCDQVFDVLTRGPFPTGNQSDVQVERHLHHCRACRQLAEALRPAIELFQEAIPAEETRHLPIYWGELSDFSDHSAEPSSGTRCPANRTSRRPSPAARSLPDRRRSRAWRPFHGLHVAVAATIAVVVCLGIYSAAEFDLPLGGRTVPPGVAKSAAIALGGENPLPHDERLVQLSRLDLQPVCIQRAGLPSVQQKFGPDAPPLVASSGLDRLHCCTECHSSRLQRPGGRAAIGTIARSCAICHP